jgi:hypothetical protein
MIYLVLHFLVLRVMIQYITPISLFIICCAILDFCLYVMHDTPIVTSLIYADYIADYR